MADTLPIEVIILAAGKGTRMRSRLPKVLHDLGGRPLLGHVLDTARAIGARCRHVVIGNGADAVRERFADEELCWAVQAEQLGTGHAVAQALPGVGDDARVLVMYADVPLVTPEMLQPLIDADPSGVGLLTAELDDPAMLGRIVRDASGAVRAIVEYKDADAEQRAIHEINTGMLIAPAARLREWMPRLSSANAQGEYYLTDIIAMAVADGVPVHAAAARGANELSGINDRLQLAAQERILQRRRAEDLMRAGVTLRDPARIDIRGTLDAGEDCEIDVDVVFEGRVRLGAGVRIGPHCYLRDVEIGADSVIHSHTSLDGARLAERCQIGPFARLRPGTDLADEVRIGNFVETKKAVLGRGSKSNHLAYLGDTTMGEGCNIGAGTITCNYDGVDKHRTDMGDRVFVGSNSTLVAPIRLGDDTFVAAGSTAISEVPDGALAVGRAKQRNIDGWTPPALRKQPSKQDQRG